MSVVVFQAIPTGVILRALACWALLSCCLPLAARADVILLTENYPPFNYPDGKGGVAGMSADIVRGIVNRAGIPYRMEIKPWKRAYLATRRHSATCLFSTAQTGEREPDFEWVGPFLFNDWVLFRRKDNVLDLKDLEDARNFRIGGYPGDAITDFLEDRGFRVDIAGDDLSNLRKLAFGRIDLWPSGLVTGKHLAAAHDVDVAKSLVLKRVPVSLACNRRIKRMDLEAMRQALDGMRQDGMLQEIGRRYGLPGVGR